MTKKSPRKTNIMGFSNLIAGTLLAVLLQILPAGMEQSEQQLVSRRQPAITVDFAVGSIATPTEALAYLSDLIQVRPSYRVRRSYAREEEGNAQDGFILVESPPPK